MSEEKLLIGGYEFVPWKFEPETVDCTNPSGKTHTMLKYVTTTEPTIPLPKIDYYNLPDFRKNSPESKLKWDIVKLGKEIKAVEKILEEDDDVMMPYYEYIFCPEKVIFNGPACIVIWRDKTKTVVKRKPYDDFDPYEAVAQAITKRIFESTSHFHKAVDAVTEYKHPDEATKRYLTVNGIKGGSNGKA